MKWQFLMPEIIDKGPDLLLELF